MIAVLPNIRSLHNVGSIFRTCDAAGIKEIYLTGYTPTPLDKEDKLLPRFKKVSIGSEKNVNWYKVKDTSQVLSKLKDDAYTLVAAELTSDSVPYTKIADIDLGKTALIMGHELDGVDESILKQCDIVAHIPMNGIKESLNVSVAFGIIVYGLMSQNKN